MQYQISGSVSYNTFSSDSHSFMVKLNCHLETSHCIVSGPHTTNLQYLPEPYILAAIEKQVVVLFCLCVTNHTHTAMVGVLFADEK